MDTKYCVKRGALRWSNLNGWVADDSFSRYTNRDIAARIAKGLRTDHPEAHVLPC